ncbi:hypothetical protein [Mycobacterium paraintracellulare]|uniref:hypothetical protein n=1 Tax=Mycobacterium paraintracellulare TaxID=1138383 RepID=UPI001928CF98|nr:hypothetical protein [Mycobacterium paraintracellulare]BCP14222.1 hypothetical protein MINTM021_11310 [Mycobacterium paraintracellulare]
MTNTDQDTMTELEFTMPTDIDTITDASPPDLDEAPTSCEATADHDEAADVCDEAEAADDHDAAAATEPVAKPVGRFSWKRRLAYGILPALALILALGAGYLRWQAESAALSQAAGAQSVQAATESTIAMLSYRPDTVDKDLPAAASRMTGRFRDDYAQLINDVVIPGAKQKKISAVATVPAVASISSTESQAVVLLFVNQTITIGDSAPTDSASSVRVTLDKVQQRWLISHFDPV